VSKNHTDLETLPTGGGVVKPRPYARSILRVTVLSPGPLACTAFRSWRRFPAFS